MDRRTFVLGSTAVVGGFAIGAAGLARRSDENPLDAVIGPGAVAITPYVVVDRDGVTIFAPRAEMGQGIHTTLAALVAEELDVLVADVRVEHGPPSEVYANRVAYPFVEPISRRLARRVENRTGVYVMPSRGTQLTGGQSSVQDAFVRMRTAGAAARLVLIEAAARKFGLDASVLRTERGAVIRPDGERIPYPRLAEAAGDIPPPADPPLRPPEAWTQLGTSIARVDMREKCTGRATFSLDVQLPGMLHGAVRRSPMLGARLESMDASRAREARGVRSVVRLDDGVVVLATNTWYAMRALDLVQLEWGRAPYPAHQAAHRKALARAIEDAPDAVWRDDGNVDAAFMEGDRVQGTYHVPYLAHATMEPLGAVAWVKDDGSVEIWAGTQNPTLARHVGARIARVPLDAVTVHTTLMGGGFGRRLEADFVAVAVRAALATRGTPVKVTWSREEDMTHDAYRPVATARCTGVVRAGRPAALWIRVASPSLGSSFTRRPANFDDARPEAFDKFSRAGVADQPYRIPHYRVTGHLPGRLLPVGWWRGVGESQNTFFHESAIDEMAHAASMDPLAMRRSLIDHEPSRAVLDLVSEMSDWGSEVPPGRGRGIAYALSSGAATAQVVEVRIDDGLVHVERVFAAVDVGIALDPRNIEAQVASGVIFGLSAAMHGAITVQDGVVRQTNFDEYPVLRMPNAPEIRVGIHESGEQIFGVGEAGTPTAAPALGNALFAVTGRRLRELPFSGSVDFA